MLHSVAFVAVGGGDFAMTEAKYLFFEDEANFETKGFGMIELAAILARNHICRTINAGGRR